MALSYRIFSLVHLLVDYAFGAATRIAMAALAGAFESASRFEGADESSAQATISTNAVVLSY